MDALRAFGGCTKGFRAGCAEGSRLSALKALIEGVDALKAFDHTVLTIDAWKH